MMHLPDPVWDFLCLIEVFVDISTRMVIESWSIVSRSTCLKSCRSICPGFSTDISTSVFCMKVVIVTRVIARGTSRVVSSSPRDSNNFCDLNLVLTRWRGRPVYCFSITVWGVNRYDFYLLLFSRRLSSSACLCPGPMDLLKICPFHEATRAVSQGVTHYTAIRSLPAQRCINWNHFTSPWPNWLTDTFLCSRIDGR